MKTIKVKMRDIKTGQEISCTLDEALQFVYEKCNAHTNYAAWCVSIVAGIGLIQVICLLGYLSYRFIGPYILK